MLGQSVDGISHRSPAMPSKRPLRVGWTRMISGPSTPAALMLSARSASTPSSSSRRGLDAGGSSRESQMSRPAIEVGGDEVGRTPDWRTAMTWNFSERQVVVGWQRLGAPRSRLVRITERLCPAEVNKNVAKRTLTVCVPALPSDANGLTATWPCRGQTARRLVAFSLSFDVANAEPARIQRKGDHVNRHPRKAN